MWRVPGVQRSNGLFKVPCTADEILAMSPESYAQLCSVPRPFPALATPKPCPKLTLLFTVARDKIGAKATRARKWSAAEQAVRARFQGAAPPSLRHLLDGKVQSREGWNRTALQLALLSHALGWDEDRLISEARGLIESHQSDGHRYNTPRKRENDLRRMFHAVIGDSAYNFSVPALRSLLPKGTPTPDLSGLEADRDGGTGADATRASSSKQNNQAAHDGAEDEIGDTAVITTENAWELLDAAGDNVVEVVRLARAYAADASATKTEVAAFMRKAAKRSGVPLKTLRADVFIASEDAADVVKPIINVTRGDYAGTVQGVLDVLPLIPTLRVRSGQLVEITQAGASHTVSPVTLARLAHLVSHYARWSYGDNFGGPDVQSLQSVMACPSWPGVAALETMAHQPYLLMDGTLIAEPGIHDGIEGTFSAGEYVEYAGTGAEALDALRDLLSEFPFEDGVSESAALAAILTATVRPMLRTAPAFVLSASDKGSGKSFLGELIGLFSGPGKTPMRRWPQRSEDVDKTLLAALIECRPALIFDNLMVPLRSASLAAILTTEEYSDRLLGASATATVSTKATFVFTGNALQAVEDMARRVAPVVLDARCENPASRSFSRDPVSEVRGDRQAWIMKALRVVQAFLLSGEAPPMTPIASFRDWSRVIRGCLIHYGLPDPGHGLLQNVTHDPDREQLGLLMDLWAKCFGGHVMTAREVVQACTTASVLSDLGTLRHLLVEVAGDRDGEKVSSQRLGAYLGARAGRVVNGLQFRAAPRTGHGVPWSVGPV